MYKTFKYRVYPTSEQQAWFVAHFEVNRFLYNVLLKATIEHYEQRVDRLFLKKIRDMDFYAAEILAWSVQDWQDFLRESRKGARGLSRSEMSRLITQIVNDPQIDWVNKNFDSRAMRVAAENVDRAFQNFYRGRGFPKFKKIGSVHTVKFPIVSQENWQSIDFVNENLIRLPKKILLKIIQHRLLEGEIKEVTVSKSASRKWFLSALTEIPEVEMQLDSEKIIALEQNLTDFLVGIDLAGEKFHWAFPAVDEALERKIRNLQKALARKQKRVLELKIPFSEAKNYQKNRLALAKLYDLRKNRTEIFLHKLVKDLLQNYDVVVLENWSVQERAQVLKEAGQVAEMQKLSL